MTQSSREDPLVYYGWHFSQTVHATCSIHTVITKGLLHVAKIVESELGLDEALNGEQVFKIAFPTPVNSRYFFIQREWAEYHVYTTIYSGLLNLEEQIIDRDDNAVQLIADLISVSHLTQANILKYSNNL